MTLTIPYNYDPRIYQLPLLRAIDSGIKRAVACWHRRSGKDKTCLNVTVKKMMERIGTYFYVFPTYNQGRKVLWDGIDGEGKRFLDHFPKEIIDGKPNDTEMKLRLKNGSLFQVVGSDNIDSIVGTNPVGVVFSEYALQDPRAWGFIRPILAENNGWTIFIATPRGENHFFDIYSLAKNSSDWFCETLTVEDTKAIPSKILETEKSEIVKLHGNDALYQQEYYCAFSVPLAGAYYANQIILANQEGRVTHVPYEDRVTVDTWWDLGAGKSDYMSIWFTQSVGAELRVIDYYQNTSEGFPHYAQVLKDKKYIYGTHNAPFDIKIREMGTGKTRIDTAKSLGINFKVVPNIPLADGIDCARSLFRKCWFDKDKCADGLNALKNYQKLYDEERKIYLDTPYHSWASHAADAFRYCAVGLNYVKSVLRESYVHKDSPEIRQGWNNGCYTPEWALEPEPVVRSSR